MESKLSREAIQEAIAYVFEKHKESKILVEDQILYITDTKETLSFKYGVLMTGLEGIKILYNSGVSLGIKEINYNGRILDEFESKKVLDKLFGQDNGKNI